MQDFNQEFINLKPLVSYALPRGFRVVDLEIESS
jgi:hypothetical protein